MEERFALEERGCPRQAALAVTAQRLRDILLSFPSAAIAGIPWQTLVRKYEERHTVRLDPTSLGQQSGLAAATSLLGDALRLVDASDVDDPTIAAQDAIVMLPCPGALGSWPSLYQGLCNAVVSHGRMETLSVSDAEFGIAKLHTDDDIQKDSKEIVYGLLLSQLKPLLQVHWHVGFDEGSLGYVSDNGNFMRLRKLKHLVQAVLHWRELRLKWIESTGSTPSLVDQALIPTLDIVHSKQQSDLILRCRRNGTIVGNVPSCVAVNAEHGTRPMLESKREVRHPRNKVPKKGHSVIPSQSGSHPFSKHEAAISDKATCDAFPHMPGTEECYLIAPMPNADIASELEKELMQLRAENAELRNKNENLEQHVNLIRTFGNMPQTFDDPFEPPPEMRPLIPNGLVAPLWAPATPSSADSTSAPMSERLSTDLHVTDEAPPFEERDGIQNMLLEQSVACLLLKPTTVTADGPASQRWVKHIPKGIVQQARAMFE